MEWVESIFQTINSHSRWYLASAITSCYMLYYLFEVVKKPILATKPKGKFSELIEKNMPILKENFWPTPWCIEPRAQTIIPLFVRKRSIPTVPYKREILTLKDGGELCLDYLEPKEGLPSNAPTIIAIPGITGSSRTDYSRGLAWMAHSLGIRFVGFNQRGSGIPLKTARTYCACNYEDFMEVVDHVKAKYEGSLLGAVGVSMGGLILVNYLSSSEGANSPISCAMLISVPWNVQIGMKSLEKPPLNTVFNRRIAARLCSIIKRMDPPLRPDNYDEILKCETIRELDNAYTARAFGYKDADDYYNSATIHDKIHKVTIPVLCLNSADDPFQPAEGIPLDVAYKMDNLCISVTSRGGHIGFMEGICPTNKEQYMFRIFCNYFKTMLLEDGVKDFKKKDDISI